MSKLALVRGRRRPKGRQPQAPIGRLKKPSRALDAQGMERQFTILLAEDDPRVREAIVALLREHGFVVLVAEDGDTALRLLDGIHVDLLLADVAMPGASGFEIAQRAKSTSPDLRLLYMTGYYAEVAADKGIRYGKILRKPFGADELLAEITQALAG
jgi:two-component system, cell cycle sensor histidine kinase and response regulator CckA